MNSAIQMGIQRRERGTVVFAFPGASTVVDLPHFVEAINAEITCETTITRRVVFDLSHVDLVFNMAGRLFDIARDYHKRYRRRQLKTEMLIPENVYEDLQRTDPDTLPERPGRETKVGGVSIVIKPRVPYAQSAVQQRKQPEMVTSYLGKVRACTEDKVTVSLFSDAEDEIVAEFSVAQFPEGQLRPGQIFRYEAVVKSPGRTEVVIGLLEEPRLAADDVLDLFGEVERTLPHDEF